MDSETSRVQVVGIYKLRLDQSLVRKAMDMKYPPQLCSAEARRKAEPVVFEELASAVLIELIVSEADPRFSVDDFAQPDCEQAAYMENYLSADGCAVVSQFERPPDNILRIAFWLHFFDPRKHLNTSYGPVAVSDPKELPERLARIIQYEPVT